MMQRSLPLRTFTQILADRGGEIGADRSVAFGRTARAVPSRLEAQAHGVRVAVQAHPVAAHLSPQRVIAGAALLGFVAQGERWVELLEASASQLHEAVA